MTVCLARMDASGRVGLGDEVEGGEEGGEGDLVIPESFFRLVNVRSSG